MIQSSLANAAEPCAVPDDGWHLWPDTQAPWKDDTIYLPGDFDLSKLPVNPPTGGWDVLSDTQGVPVTLPSTVEQHFWGKLGLRPYTGGEYTSANNDTEVQNGSYQGVSWWWCNLDVPSSFAGKIALLHLRGMRQRAEIYVNHQLVGYDIIAETAFDSDITKALLPGQKNQIAIRITNPGGRFDWIDASGQPWGKFSVQKSHGFGGLDRGITLTAHAPVYISDHWVLNTPKVHTVTACATLCNTGSQAATGMIRFDIVDPSNQAVMASQKIPVTVPASSSQDFQASLSSDQAVLWNLNSPRLYEMHATWESTDKGMQDEATRSFGFRWFEPRGIGQQAGLFLNDQRIRLYTAISWGFWGLNGLWPTPELAEKEVRDAKQLHMNMLNFHRDIGKEEVLAMQDKLGLLRYMEPGGGGNSLGIPQGGDQIDPHATVDTSGTGGDAKDFSQRYEDIKILRMVRQFRSHPSLVIYVIQNETNPVLARQPRVFNLLRQMHALDPSRVIVMKSGISPTQEAWYAPYNDTIHVDDGTGFSGWRDQHTVGGPGVWQDALYKGPGDFTHQIDDRKEIVDWGEMLGSAVADNHALMVQQIKAHGGKSYDLKDHQEIADAYHQFLDKWGFREAFPTDQAFFTDLGNKCYEFWGRVMETARLNESSDILTISGWESTAIENHSGLVDNLRNFKGDPALIAAKLAPLLPVVEPHGQVHAVGEDVPLDLYLLNETGHAVSGQLQLTETSPSGQVTSLGTFDVPPYVQDQFVYPVKMGVDPATLSEEGNYKFDFTLKGSESAQNSVIVHAFKGRTDLPPLHIGVVGGKEGDIRNELHAPQVTVETYKEGATYDMVIASPPNNGHFVTVNDGAPIKNTDDEALYRTSLRGGANNLRLHFDGLPPGPAKVTLYFCETERGGKGQRVFDVAINGKVVLPGLDILSEANGKDAALVKTFDVDASTGTIEISVPKVSLGGEGLLNAVKIEVGPQTLTIACSGEAYTDKTGQVWKPYTESSAFSAKLLQQVQAGLPLLILADSDGAGDTAARQLATVGAFQYLGQVPKARAPWMGSWIFVRKHPLYDGLPVNEVMKGDYQMDTGAAYGLNIDGPGVEIIAAYSRDHDRKIGASTFLAQLGQGHLVFQALTHMPTSMKERWLQNAVFWLTQKH